MVHRTFVVREMMPKDFKWEFLTGPRKFDGIIINEMMVDDGPLLVDLGNVGTHDEKKAQSELDTTNDISYEAGKGAGKKGPNGPGVWHRGKELLVAEEMTDARKEARRAPRGAIPIGAVTRTKEALETKARGRAKARARARVKTRYCYDCGEQGHIGVNCPYKWANSIDEEDDQTSSWESEREGENVEELASLETPDKDGEWFWPKKSRVTN